MKLAIGTTDGAALCDHFARSSAFVVLDIDGGRVASRSLRERGSGACGSHKSFLDLLEGCHVVLCGGISEAMEQTLSAHGIESVVSAAPHPVEQAAALYLAGKLQTTAERTCICH